MRTVSYTHLDVYKRQLDASDAILQRLGSEPDQPGLLNDLRRGMHTLKGSSRMAGFMTVGDLAHAAESVLDALGKGALQAAPPILDAVQHALDLSLIHI